MYITNRWLYIAAYALLASFIGYLFGGAAGAFTAVCVMMVFFIVSVLVALLALNVINKFFSQR